MHRARFFQRDDFSGVINMRFDIISFLIGFGTASIISAILYRFRKEIRALRRTAETSAGTTRRFITSSSENRYFGALVKEMNSYHVAGDLVNLSEIFVEPRFLTAVHAVDPADDAPSSV